MAIKRLTKTDPALSFGVFNPVGHLVLAFRDDATAEAAQQDLLDHGFEHEDVLLYSAREEQETMSHLLEHIGTAAHFGHEVTLMRLYKAMAEKGSGWLMVYAPDEAHCQRALDVARRHDVLLGEKYHRLVIEDLV